MAACAKAAVVNGKGSRHILQAPQPGTLPINPGAKMRVTSRHDVDRRMMAGRAGADGFISKVNFAASIRYSTHSAGRPNAKSESIIPA